MIGAGKIYVASLGGGNAAYGVLFGSVFVGLGAGMAFGPRIARELSRRRLFGLSMVFGGDLPRHRRASCRRSRWRSIFVLGVGFGAGVAYLSGMTLMGTDVDDAMRGRVFAVAAVAHPRRADHRAGRGAVRGRGSRQAHLPHRRHERDASTALASSWSPGGCWQWWLALLAFRKMDDGPRCRSGRDLKTALRGDSAKRRRMGDGGVFIAFEGGEGSGKSTQIELLAAALRDAGVAVVVTREPGATTVGRRIRDLLLHDDEPLSPRAEALLFAADRAHHVATVIQPALDRGDVVLTDRYIDSSMAYQGAGRELTFDEIRRVSGWATSGLTPDLTVLLDIPAATGLERARGRNARPAAAGSDADKLERESLEFHERVRDGVSRTGRSRAGALSGAGCDAAGERARAGDPGRRRRVARQSPAAVVRPAARRRAAARQPRDTEPARLMTVRPSCEDAA